ncbi:hypothetical protein FQA39_LY17058 [Lamprigera yunnana]|nr:hypothetical protein FQA39_LY17058 [Lamprigera yunnana]
MIEISKQRFHALLSLALELFLCTNNENDIPNDDTVLTFFSKNLDAQTPPSSHMGHRVSLTPRCHSAKVWDDSVTVDVRRKSAISRLCSSSNYGPERGADGTVLLRVPAPHVVAARAYRISSPSTSGLYKLTRLLNQGGKHQTVVDDTNVPRRLSWERKLSGTRLPRSSSIDSMVETIWADSISETTTSSPVDKRPSIRLDRPLTLVSPTVGRRMKGQRGINVERLYEKLGALEFNADHEAIYGMEKYYTVKQCEKLRDKYKIEKKVCRQFLKGKTCSQCLVKHIIAIELQHFLDTISKYIKDCSDSDTSSYSSDEEECKEAVEQNDEDSKTTKEEESKKSKGGRNTKPFS